MEAKRTRIDVGSWCVRRVAVPSSDVAKCGDIGLLAINSIATADLIDIAGAGKVAIRLGVEMIWSIVTTPALRVVLSTCKDIASSCTLSDASFVGVAVAARNLSLELAARIIFEKAASISIFRLLCDWVERWCLLRDCVADELDSLLLEGQIVEIHRPLRRTIVRININLGLWYRAVERSSHILSSIDQSAFS